MASNTALPFSESRSRRLYSELTFALSNTDRDTLGSWGGRSARGMVLLAARRIRALSNLASAIGKGSLTEFKSMMGAMRDGRGWEHLGNRTAAAIDGSVEFSQKATKVVGGVGGALVNDPKTNAPRVMAAFLGFYAGSGGLDGNGGIPDLDLMAGIDAHRSILTHSILAGVLAEGVLLAVADLASQIHDRLPADHDPLWDKLAESSAPLNASLMTGASAGIAYHLLVDAGIQPAPYHGLPFEMPIEAHQTIMGVNGLAEGAYAAAAGNLERATVGRRVVDGVGAVSTVATNMTKGFWSGVKKGYADAEAERKKRNRAADDGTNPACQVWRPESDQGASSQ